MAGDIDLPQDNHREIDPPKGGVTRLTVVISSLEAGGAQRVLTCLANYWAANGWDVTILTLVDGNSRPFFKLNESVNVTPLGIYKESNNWFRRIINNVNRLMILRRAVGASSPQVLVSMMDRTNVLVLAAMLFKSTPVIVSEHTAIGVARIGLVWELARWALYPFAAVITVLTDRARDYFPQYLQRKVEVFPNPVLIQGKVSAQRTNKDGRKTCIAVGSLRHEKGFDLLLEAFAILSSRYPEWDLQILGEGPLREVLQENIAELKLVGRVKLMGYVDQPEEYLKNADLFVLSSRLEGFPMALCEAMACGLPVVAADCLTGPREIVRHGVDGLLVEAEDVAALTETMGKMMADEELRTSLAAEAVKLPERFRLSDIAQRWEDLFREVGGV